MITTSNKRETFEDTNFIVVETLDRQSNEESEHQTHSPHQDPLFTLSQPLFARLIGLHNAFQV